MVDGGGDCVEGRCFERSASLKRDCRGGARVLEGGSLVTSRLAVEVEIEVSCSGASGAGVWWETCYINIGGSRSAYA